MGVYCTEEDIELRLTSGGLDGICDRDRDGTRDPDTDALIDEAIQYASSIMDQHLIGLFPLQTVQSAGNPLLTQICVDIAIERLASVGSGNPSDAVYISAKRARERLVKIRNREEYIPGISYYTPLIRRGDRHRPIWGQVVND